jgi:hypothetical protein
MEGLEDLAPIRKGLLGYLVTIPSMSQATHAIRISRGQLIQECPPITLSYCYYSRVTLMCNMPPLKASQHMFTNI